MSKKESPEYLNDEYVNRMNELGEALKQGENETANRLIGELTTLRESSLFQELGKITREIHESINSFRDDQRVVELTQEEIPDAKERLNYIVTKTEQAAHRTMTGAEAAMDVIDEFNQSASTIQQRWRQFRTSKLSKSDFLALSDDIDAFLSSIQPESDKVRSKMTDIMMAQDYQDLTGQMIKQVVSMVQEVEEKLVRLVAISGAKLAEPGEGDKHSDGTMAHGPQLPTADKAEVATNQDEVDDLLASLGF
jgi:chemotaxis protein CheZ